MIGFKGFKHWRWTVGIATVGVLALGLTLQGAPGEKAPLEMQKGVLNTDASSGFGSGPKVPISEDDSVFYAPQGTIPIAPEAFAIPGASGNPDFVGLGGGVAIGSCRFSIECDDCDPCTRDVCALGTCIGGTNDTLGCQNSADCIGGGSCSIGSCATDGNPCTTGDDCVSSGNCVQSTDFFGKCANFAVPEGGAGGCNDGLECNGVESCDANGDCVGGTPLCNVEDRCVEANDTCFVSCLLDAECEDVDNLLCNGIGICDPKTCVGGANEFDPCRDNSECDSGDCSGGGTGTCSIDPSSEDPCGEGAICNEGANSGDPVVCGPGRCCDPNDINNCEQTTAALCPGGFTFIGGSTGEVCSGADPDQPALNEKCPNYSGGIAPQGNYTVSVGGISISGCDIETLGDDYTVVDKGGTGFILVRKVRFAAGVVPGASVRFGVEFRSSDGTFIEDFFFGDGVNIVGGNAIREVNLLSPLVVPASGIVSLRAREEFGPNGRITWLATDGTDVGTNDAGSMYVNGEVVTDFLGECNGGDRDGQWCNRGASIDDPQQGCPGTGTTCDDVPDVLAFEIVGDSAQSPAGACCDSETGLCSIQLPWDCREADGSFQGAGSSCFVCSGDPFVSCNADPDCSICIDGSNAGNPCTDNAECPGIGAFCDLGGFCRLVPPACTQNACCDKSGTCVTVIGGLCSGNSAECRNDAECPKGETCEANCISGTPQGFGTDCEPNCCDQSAPSGGDFCGDAPEHAIHVPLPGEIPLSYTFTGDNSLATFGEYADDCDESPLPADNCCESGLFNPDGNILDRGWWEVIRTDACSDMRVDLCCSDPVKRPAWGFGLWKGCTCGNATGTQVVEEPIGNNTDDGERGGPFCTGDDNFWFTMNNVPRGRWSYPILSTPAGARGPYSLHVTVEACEQAACCSPICGPPPNGSVALMPRTGRPCSARDVTACPSGECIGGICDGGPLYGQACEFCPSPGVCTDGTCLAGDRDGLPCIVDQCGGGTCEEDACPGGTCVDGICDGGPLDTEECIVGCTVTDQIECEFAGGSFHGTDSTGAEDDNVNCGVGTPQDPFLCGDGACCTGPAECVDTFGGARLIKSDCVDILDGLYIAGGRCNFAVSPCPACGIGSPSEPSANCQDVGSGAFVLLSDQDVGNGQGFVRAEDFIIASGAGVIDELCTQGAWIGTSDNPDRVDCACVGDNQDDCVPKVEDNFIITIYNDNGGIPGTVFATRSGDEVTMVRVLEQQFGNFDIWNMSITLDPPITGLFPGIPYFLEIKANTDRPFGAEAPGPNECSWFWSESNGSLANDNYSMAALGGYTRSSVSTFDCAFCLPDPLARTTAPLGACCDCGFLGCLEVPFSDCTNNDFNGGGAGDLWRPGETCSGQCPNSEPFGSDCATEALEVCDNQSFAAGECPAGSLEPPIAFDNRCAGTDGPSPEPTEFGESLMEADLWFNYVTTCTGRVLVSNCVNTTFDTVIGLYWDPTNPTVCPCPSDPGFTRIGTTHDGGCSVGFIGAVADQLVQDKEIGTCLTVRVAGWGDPDESEPSEEGQGQFTIDCLEQSCFVSAPAEPEFIKEQISRKTRYLSFLAGDIGRTQAIRVEFVTLEAPYDIWNGTRMWVGEPVVYCENSGQGTQASVGGNCGPSPGLAEGTYLASTLECSPFFTEWAGACDTGSCVSGFRDGESCVDDADCKKVVHVFHDAIAPGSFFDLQVIEENCALTLEPSYSPILSLTTSKWGDLIKDFTTDPPGPPDDSVDITSDVTAILQKFQNTINLTMPRADVEPLTLNGKGDIADVTFVLDAFTGVLFQDVSFVPEDPGDAPCTTIAGSD